MKPFWRIALIGALAISVFDVAASLLTVFTGIPYAYQAPGSFLIFACVGYFAMKAGGLWWSAGAGTIVGLVESTIGWYLSWQIGPGAVTEIEPDAILFAVTIMVVTLSATFFALIGGGVARLRHGAHRPQASTEPSRPAT